MKLVLFLVEKANHATLVAQDAEGNTPLHLAVAFEPCTHSQLDIVRALVRQCDEAMDVLTKAPQSIFSLPVPCAYSSGSKYEKSQRKGNEKIWDKHASRRHNSWLYE